MCTRNVSRKFLIVTTAALLCMAVGCDGEGEPTGFVDEQPDCSKAAGKTIGTGGLIGELSTVDRAMFTTHLGHCTVDILGVTMDRVSNQMTVTVDAFYDDHEAVRRVLTMQFYEEGVDRIGYRSTLNDLQGHLKWEFDFAMSTGDDHRTWITERTEMDCMTIEQSSGEDEISEEYTINGLSRTFGFETSDVSRIGALHERMRSGEFGSVADLSMSLTNSDAKILNTLGEFEEFYERGNTLHDNPDGFLVADLLTSHAVAAWIENEFPSEFEPQGSLTRWAWLCDAAAICAAIKCPMGANPACEVCGAIVLTCAVMDYFSLW